MTNETSEKMVFIKNNDLADGAFEQIGPRYVLRDTIIQKFIDGEFSEMTISIPLEKYCDRIEKVYGEFGADRLERAREEAAMAMESIEKKHDETKIFSKEFPNETVLGIKNWRVDKSDIRVTFEVVYQGAIREKSVRVEALK